MKNNVIRILIAVIIILIIPAFCLATSLQWNAVTTNTDGSPATLSGYKCYDVTGTRIEVDGVIPTSNCTGGICTWTFPTTPTEGQKVVVTAVATNGLESADSNIATYHTIPSSPSGLMWK